MPLYSTGNSSYFMYNLTFALQKYRAGLLVSVLIRKEIRNHPSYPFKKKHNEQIEQQCPSLVLSENRECRTSATSKLGEISESRAS